MNFIKGKKYYLYDSERNRFILTYKGDVIRKDTDERVYYFTNNVNEFDWAWDGKDISRMRSEYPLSFTNYDPFLPKCSVKPFSMV